jgi:aspartyl-tRNA(Asn)/glutamyl-tRNA(Gln) amidotransferase subunit A
VTTTEDRTQALLRALREQLETSEEPATTFRAHRSAAAGKPPAAEQQAAGTAPSPAAFSQGEREPDVCFLSIAELGAAFRARRLSPLEVVEAYLRRIERLEPQVHAFVTLTADRASDEARTAEAELGRGQDRGSLHGVPVALKDLYNTAGLRTTAHSRLLLDNVPTEDATCVRRLAEVGSVLLGKLSMHEFAFGGPDPEGPSPPARNPWSLDRIPAGSSSGSGAGLAAGFFAGSLGSDTGGSIRGPASYCGIVGLKPTYGLCSRFGVLPLAWSLDHAGPMARRVEDCAILLQAIAGYDPRDPASANVPVPDYRAELQAGVAGLRIGAPLAYLDTVPDLAPDTYAAFRAALSQLEQLGACVQSVDLPEAEHHQVVGSTIIIAEAYAYHQHDLTSRPEQYGRRFRDRVLEAASLTAADYLALQRGRAKIVRGFRALMSEIDLLALPTTPHPAHTFAEDDAVPSWKRTSFTRPFNITGQPAISVPCGFSSTGLPIGLQLAGRPFDDLTVLRAAQAYEQATDWHTRNPAL